LDGASAEERYRLEPLDGLTAEHVFDARWALTLLEKAMSLLCAEYPRQGKAAILETLKPFLDPLDGPGSPSYEQAADRLQVSLGAVKTLIHRVRKQYQALLREEVARTMDDPAEVDEEIHALCTALIATEGRLGP
jgi:RNA polymerase sigma-70 factor (ECF subfamily)